MQGRAKLCGPDCSPEIAGCCVHVRDKAEPGEGFPQTLVRGFCRNAEQPGGGAQTQDGCQHAAPPQHGAAVLAIAITVIFHNDSSGSQRNNGE